MLVWLLLDCLVCRVPSALLVVVPCLSSCLSSSSLLKASFRVCRGKSLLGLAFPFYTSPPFLDMKPRVDPLSPSPRPCPSVILLLFSSMAGRHPSPLCSSSLLPLPSPTCVQAETTALEPVDFADVELAPLDKNNLRRLMHEDVLAYRPELRSPAAGSSLPEPASRTGGREAARDGGGRGSSSSAAAPPPPPHGGAGGSNGAVAPGGSSSSSHVSSRMANGGVSANTHGAGVGGQRERSSRSDRDRDGRSSGGISGTSGRSSSAAAGSSGRSAENGGGRSDGRTHVAARVRSGGAVARHPFPTEG